MIHQITPDDVRRMAGREALILQGCGGDLRDWVGGINDWLTEEDILRNGSRFRDVWEFRRGGLENLMFPLDAVDVDMARLADWRLRTHDNLGGMWLSDYVPNCLGGWLVDVPDPTPARSGLLRRSHRCLPRKSSAARRTPSPKPPGGPAIPSLT